MELDFDAITPFQSYFGGGDADRMTPAATAVNHMPDRQRRGKPEKRCKNGEPCY